VFPELQKIAMEEDPKSSEMILLVKLQAKWENHGIMVRWMQRFFQYLDRFYVEINSLTPLLLQGTKIFKTVIFQPLVTNITQSVLYAIDRERNEELVDVDLIKKTIEIFLSLSNEKMQQDNVNCIKTLEDRIIDHTKSYYIQQSQALLHTASLSEYL
jgi:cullin 1